MRWLYLAKWTTRLSAWLIDVVLVSAIASVVGDAVGPLLATPFPAGADFLVDASVFGGLDGFWL